jgi:hypothetical protein
MEKRSMKKRIFLSLALAIIVCQTVHTQTASTPSVEISQSVHNVPFCSSGNTIQLQIANASASHATHIVVEVQNVPGWIQMIPHEQTISVLKAGAEVEVMFTFSVGRMAPVNKEETLSFTVHAEGSDEQWVKQIRIVVDAPRQYALSQNYPNPFNPTTSINYQLPIGNSQLTVLKVYDVLGQEVVTLVNEVNPPGGYVVQWDASNVPSGLYFYRLMAGSFSETRKMVLVK